MPQTWDRVGLTSTGFVGWHTAADLGDVLPSVPQSGGVYVVTQPAGAAPDFLEANPGGRFKGKDPTVPASQLEANWVEGAELVYVGKADNLQRRLREFLRFGAGHRIGHWGGRLIWQLARSDELRFAWRETPGEVPREVETAMLREFREAFGKPPLANDPHRLGM